MFKGIKWRVDLPPEKVLRRLEKNLIGEDALRQRVTERLEEQFAEWRLADRPVGRVAGNRFRLFMPRERMGNPMAPVLRGRVLATPAGSRIVGRVGFSGKTICILAFLAAIWLAVAVPWIIVRIQGGETSWAYLLLVPVLVPDVLGVLVILGILRWVARRDTQAFIRFMNEQFRKDLIRSDSTDA